MCDLLETDRKAVLKLYNKTENSVKDDIQLLKQWLTYQKYLPEIDNKRLERMLLNRKFSLEKTKQMINTYFTMRNYVPEIFENRDPKSMNIQNMFKTAPWIPLRRLTDNYERVSIMKFVNSDPNEFEPWDHFSLNLMIEEIRLHYEYCNGNQIIFDLEGCKFGHLLKMTPTVIAKSHKVHMDAYGLRLSGIHIINAPNFLDNILSIFKPIIKPKLFDRIHIHRNLDSLHDFISIKVLPKDYGGEDSNFETICEKWNSLLKEWRPWFLIDMKTRCDETKRPTDTLKSDLFGSIHGTFKKLDID